MIELVIIDTHSGANRRVPWQGRTITVGSGIDSDLVLPDDGIDPQHCRLDPAGDGVRLVDLGSKSGTKRNEQRVGRAKLHVGDVLEVGRFRLILAGAEEQATPAPAAAPPEEAPAPAPVAPPPAPAAAAPPPEPVTPPPPPPETAPASEPAPAAVPALAPAAEAETPEPAAPVAPPVTKTPAAQRETRPRRAGAEKSSSGSMVGAAVLLLIAVIGLLYLSDLFSDGSSEKDGPSPLQQALGPVRKAVESCRFDFARQELAALRVEYGSDPAVTGLEESLADREREFDRGMEELDTAEQLAKAGSSETALRQFEKVAGDYATLQPVRARAMQLLGRYEVTEAAPKDPSTPFLTEPDNLDKWLPMVAQHRARDEYSEALRILRGLQPASSADAKRARAEWSNTQDSARKKAQSLVDAAERHREAGRLFLVLNVLHDREVGPYRGTDVWHELMELADRVEDKIDEDIPSHARPVPRKKHSRKRSPPPDYLHEQARVEHAQPTRPNEKVFPTRRVGEAVAAAPSQPGAVSATDPDAILTVPELISGAEQRLAEQDFADAQRLVALARLKKADAGSSATVSLFERAERPLALATLWATHLEEDPPSKPPVVELRDGREAQVLSSSEGRLTVRIGDEEQQIAPSDLSGRALLKVTRRLRLTAQDHVNRAYLAREVGDEETMYSALERAAREKEVRGDIFALVAFHRGMDAVPSEGFFLVNERWVTLGERDARELGQALEKAITRLEKEPDLAQELIGQLFDQDPLVVVDGLVAHLSEVSVQWNEAPERAKLEGLREQRAKLDEARGHALELIYDTKKYFYPYRPPQVSAERASEYREVQQEVDRRVQLVRDLWGNERGDWSGPSVGLSAKTAKLVEEIHLLRDVLWALSGNMELDPATDEVALLPRGQTSVHLRNFALNEEERRRLDRDVQVRAYNAGLEIDHGERTQMKVTNDYRVMMGRRRMAYNEKVYKAAKWHADWMGRTGVFGHFEEDDPERRTPFDRLRKEGYTQGAGENCAISGGPTQAHDGWVHSSGHHRNLLYEGHTEMASANSGRYWVQNFGGGSEYSGNLVE